MFLPEVTDQALVEYARKVLSADVEEAKVNINAVGRVVSDAAIASFLYRPKDIADIKAEISRAASFEFDPPGGFPVLVLMDRYNLLVTNRIVTRVLHKDLKCPEQYVTVLDKRSYGRNLGRMHIQPKPYTAKEMQDIARRMKHDRDLAPAQIVRQAVRYGETV
jgi:hypothetical protein